jgi:hypothetical protein
VTRAIGQGLRRIRLARGLTQQELAHHLAAEHSVREIESTIDRVLTAIAKWPHFAAQAGISPANTNYCLFLCIFPNQEQTGAVYYEQKSGRYLAGMSNPSKTDVRYWRQKIFKHTYMQNGVRKESAGLGDLLAPDGGGVLKGDFKKKEAKEGKGKKHA